MLGDCGAAISAVSGGGPGSYAPEVRIAENAVGQIGVTKVGILKAGAPMIRAAEVGTSLARSSKIGTRKIEAADFGRLTAIGAQRRPAQCRQRRLGVGGSLNQYGDVATSSHGISR